jgi:Mn-containing catalase
MSDLKDLLVDQLQDLLNAENQIVGALPKMVEAAKNPKLKEAFEKHLTQTETHVARLEQALETLEGDTSSEPCLGMKGLLDEGEEIIENSEDTGDLAADLALIGAAQKVEHYEISGYGTAKCLAKQIGEIEIAKLLSQTLGEEESTDFLLTTLTKPILEQATSEEFGNGTKMPWGEPGDPNMKTGSNGDSKASSGTRFFSVGAGASQSQSQGRSQAQPRGASQSAPSSEQPRGSSGRPTSTSSKPSLAKTSKKGR